ncbi:NPNT [Branchiostoma lanceolatum]|uniref:NPNT protein n=1 Tax=Branchiostoma lanceolatum TaxID=7740 RepID=A0A8J9V9X6_BRALA|nr:NPNT [Branchiostoma lanceolatum]
MKKDCFCGVYYVVSLVVIVAVENTLALTGPTGSVCGSQCCTGWDQVGDTCQAHCYHPCVHGTCVDTNICDCDPGWEGHQCEHDIDECWYETHICHHNCENHDGCYTCSCDDGFQLINSTHCVLSTTANTDSATATPPQTATRSNLLCVAATTSAMDRTTARTTRPTASVVDGGADHHKVDMAIGAGVSAVALVLLFVSLGIFIRYKKKKKTSSYQQEIVSYHPQHPHGSLPGYTDTHWRNPVFENLHEERPKMQTPPPPYCEAAEGFVASVEISKGGMTHANVVSVGIGGMSVLGTIPESKELTPPCDAPLSLDPRHIGDFAATQRFDSALNEFHQ